MHFCERKHAFWSPSYYRKRERVRWGCPWLYGACMLHLYLVVTLARKELC